MTEQEEFEFRQRLEQEQAAPTSSVEVRGATEADLIDPLYGTIGGAFVGQAVGPAVNKGVEAMRSGAPSAPSAPGTPGGASPGQKFAAKTGYGSGTGYTVEEVVEHKKAQEKPIGKGKISSKIASNSPMNVDRMLQLEAAKKAEDARRAAALAPTGLMAKMPEPVQAASRFLGGAAQSGLTPYLGRAVAGGGAGYQGFDAYNRFQQGDYPGAAISGLGALGSAAAFVPTPLTRFGGSAVGIGAEMLNMYLDSLKKKVEGVGAPAAASAPASAPGMAKGGRTGALESIAKKTKGFLESTPLKPNELVGTRFKSTDLGGLIEPTPFDIESALGAKVIHRPYDLSGRNQRIEEISGHKLLNPVITEGGQPFGRDIKLQATGQGGASNKSINDRILKRVEAAAKEGDGRVFNVPSSMTYGSEAFSNMPIDILLDLIKQRELPTDTLKYLSNLVRAKNPNLQKFVGFEHPEVAKQFTEGGFELATTPGKLRIAGTNVLTGKTNKAQELLDYNQEDLFAAIRAPELRDVPPGYMGQTIMEAVPGHPGFKTGSHRAYDSGDASTYRGQGINAPISIWMPDQYKQALAEVRSAPKTAGNSPGHQRAMARNVLGTAESGVAQTITPQVADNLQRYQEAISSGKLDAKDLDAIHRYIYGKKAEQYAKGGKVLSAIKKMSEEAREAYKAKFTPGFYHGSPDPSITSFDPLKSTKRDVDLVTPGVTFATKHPKFADSFTNGKGPYISLKTGEAMPAELYTKGATMYPVSIDLSNHFDPMTPEGFQVVRDYVAKKYADNPEMASKFKSRIQDPHSNWTSMESPSFLQHLRDTGHTSFAVNESGYPNVGVFDPTKIRGKFAKYNPEDAESPDFMKAEGGPVQNFSRGGIALAEEIIKHTIGQHPKVAQALEEYLKGNITKQQQMDVTRQYLPIRQWDKLPPDYTDEQIRNALRSNQLDKALAPVPVRKETGNRLDINAYTNNNPPVFVDTVHDINDNNKVISYNRTGHLKDVNFKSLPNSAVMMGLGTREQALTPMGAQMGKSKAPIAMIQGTNVGTSDAEVRRMMQEMMKDPAYTQIGMDPRVGSQFYDKATDRPIWTSGEKFQAGPLVIVPKKDIETTDWNDPRLLLKKFPGKTYAKGGLAALKKKK